MKKLLRLLARVILILPAVVFQILWFWVLLKWLSPFSSYISILSTILQAFIVLDILNQRGESKYRLLWIILVLTLPIFGTWLYFLGGNRRTSKPIIKKMKKGNKFNKKIHISGSIENKQNLENSTYQTLNLVQHLTNYPVLKLDFSKYYSLGEEMYQDMIDDLKNAKYFIFMEYFIIERGKFWNNIVEILKQKVKENVDVRVLYDDFGSISTHSLSSWRALKRAGIKIAAFNPVTAVKFTLNNRDHRKMTIIDGKILYSGGLNIADEYINEKNRFGHWKDIGFKLMGKPVVPYFNMFSEFWNIYSKYKINEKDFKIFLDLIDESQAKKLFLLNSKNQNNMKINKILANFQRNLNKNAVFLNKKTKPANYFNKKLNELVINSNLNCNIYSHKEENNFLSTDIQSKINNNESLVLSYYDSPNKIEQISNKFFINILGSATKYAYFYTPYLIIGESLKEAFILAVQRGIDVRIIIPGVPDKKMVYHLTKKYAEDLTMFGVKVYTYTPGFLHAKASIVDDRICSIGTVNLDYRSLYLHFENNSVFVDKNMIQSLKKDFLETESKSKLIQIPKTKRNIFKRIYRIIIDLFSPLV